MEFSFTMYEPKKQRITNVAEPLVEISTSGRIILNTKATELLNNYQFCMLGYDMQNKALGIMPIQEKKLNCFPIRYAAKGAYIGAKRFFKHFNILPTEILHRSPVVSGGFIGIQF